jgi:hypothetical protein
LRLSALFLMLAAAPALAQEKKEKKSETPPKVEKKSETSPKVEKKSEKTVEKKVTDTYHFSGDVTRSDPARPGPERAGCHFKVHPCMLYVGKQYLIDMIDPARSGMDPFLIVEDDKGTLLARDDDSGGNLNARLVFTPTGTGTYRIIATTCSPGMTGHYQLTVRPLAPGEAPPPIMGMTPPVMMGGAPGRATPVATPTFPSSFGDIVITPVPQPPHNNNMNEESHGYVEYRFLIENRSEKDSHSVTLILPKHRNSTYGPIVYLNGDRRSVEVGPQSTVPVSLWQPDLQIINTGAEVVIDGRVRDETVMVQMVATRGSRYQAPWAKHGGPGGVQYHVLSAPEIAGALRDNVHKSAVERIGAIMHSPFGIYAFQYKGKMYQYNYAHAFYNAPEPLKGWSRNWLGYSAYDGVAVAGEQLRAAPAEVQAALWQYVECGGALLIAGPCAVPEGWQRKMIEGPGLTRYYPGFGTCLMTAVPDPAQWEPEQWRPIAQALEQGNQPYAQVRTPTDANRALPVTDSLGIPVRSLLALMFVFSLLIGPINVYILYRIKRKIWLLWTVPAFSFLTCVAIFGFMLISEGWTGQTRLEGLTVLDENAQRAASAAWLGVYAPVTPGDGLHFSYGTEVVPHFKANPGHYRYNAATPLTMDWTTDQHLTSGWVSARVPAHFLLRSGAHRLERLMVEQEGGKLSITNGLGAPISKLWVGDAQGRLYSAADIPAGGKAEARPTGDRLTTTHDGVRELFLRDWLGMVKRIEDVPGHFLAPGSYFAILDGTPFLEEGLRQARPHQSRSAVLGILKGSGNAR